MEWSDMLLNLLCSSLGNDEFSAVQDKPRVVEDLAAPPVRKFCDKRGCTTAGEH
jgi:hypothetical protein